MTPHAQAEQAAREWMLDTFGYLHEEKVSALTTLLLAQRAAVLEAVAREIEARVCGKEWPMQGVADWCRQQAQEARG